MTEAQRATLIRPGERTIGRAKGTPNALTVSVREAVERAFDKLGGASYLEHVGRDGSTDLLRASLQVVAN